jgi:hypothetical protein
MSGQTISHYRIVEKLGGRRDGCGLQTEGIRLVHGKISDVGFVSKCFVLPPRHNGRLACDTSFAVCFSPLVFGLQLGARPVA